MAESAALERDCGRDCGRVLLILPKQVRAASNRQLNFLSTKKKKDSRVLLVAPRVKTLSVTFPFWFPPPLSIFFPTSGPSFPSVPSFLPPAVGIAFCQSAHPLPLSPPLFSASLRVSSRRVRVLIPSFFLSLRLHFAVYCVSFVQQWGLQL